MFFAPKNEKNANLRGFCPFSDFSGEIHGLGSARRKIFSILANPGIFSCLSAPGKRPRRRAVARKTRNKSAWPSTYGRGPSTAQFHHNYILSFPEKKLVIRKDETPASALPHSQGKEPGKAVCFERRDGHSQGSAACFSFGKRRKTRSPHDFGKDPPPSFQRKRKRRAKKKRFSFPSQALSYARAFK